MYGTYNVSTWSFHLFVLFQLLQVQFRYRLEIPKQPEQNSYKDIRAKLKVMYRHYNHTTRWP